MSDTCLFTAQNLGHPCPTQPRPSESPHPTSEPSQPGCLSLTCIWATSRLLQHYFSWTQATASSVGSQPLQSVNEATPLPCSKPSGGL